MLKSELGLQPGYQCFVITFGNMSNSWEVGKADLATAKGVDRRIL